MGNEIDISAISSGRPTLRSLPAPMPGLFGRGVRIPSRPLPASAQQQRCASTNAGSEPPAVQLLLGRGLVPFGYLLAAGPQPDSVP